MQASVIKDYSVFTMQSLLLVLLFVTAAIADPGHDITNKLLKKKIPKRFVPVHDGPNQIKEEKKTEENLQTIQDAAPKPENSSASNTDNVEDKNENVRKKKSAVTTFCVEIRPSNPYQKPFQVCEPESASYSSYAQPAQYAPSSKPYAAPAYSKPIATTSYGGSSDSSYSAPYSAPKDTYHKPAASSGGYSSNSHSTGTYPAASSSPAYRSKSDVVGQPLTDNALKSENSMEESRQIPPVLIPFTTIEPVKRSSMDDEDDDEDDELQERTSARTLKEYPRYIAYSKPSKHTYKKGSHNGLIITCSPSLAGVAHTVPHEYGFGYGHASGHGEYGGYKRSDETEGMFNLDDGQISRSTGYGYTYGYNKGTSKYGGGHKKGGSKGYEVYEYKAPSKHESSHEYEAPKYEMSYGYGSHKYGGPMHGYKKPAKHEMSYGYEAPKYESHTFEASKHEYKKPSEHEVSYGYEAPKFEGHKHEYSKPGKYEMSYGYEAPKYESHTYEAPKHEYKKPSEHEMSYGYEAPKFEGHMHEYKKPAEYEMSHGYEAPKYEKGYESYEYEAPKFEAPKYEAQKYGAMYEAPKHEDKYGHESEGYGKAESEYKPPGTYRSMDSDDIKIMMPTARSSDEMATADIEDQTKSLKLEAPSQATDMKDVVKVGGEIHDVKDLSAKQTTEPIVGLGAPASLWSEADLGKFREQESLLRATNKESMDEMNRKRMSGGGW